MSKIFPSIFFPAFILISFLYLPISEALPSSQLSAGTALLDGATLLSSGGIFELGFFSPGNSTNRCYIGIWYRNSSRTALWVANRNSPVPDKSGSLAFTKDGNLAILNSQKSILWSSKVANLQLNNSAAELLDTGNLILNNSGATVWQSFDHPCDAYLPGMKVGLDLATNANQVVLTSWRSEDDPATGNFSVGMSPDGSTQFFIWEGGEPRWRSGWWNGQVFIGIQNMGPAYIYGFKLSNFQKEKRMYFYYWQLDSPHRFFLSPDGVIGSERRHLVTENNTINWYQSWAQPNTKCGLYNRCGNNAVCSDSSGGKMATCGCLRGFESGNLSGECVRRTPLLCERSNGGSGGAADWFF